MEFKHFSHNHNLSICQIQPEHHHFICSGCNSPCYGSVFVCWQCKFFIHDHCAKARRYLNHPSHNLHPLILLPSPTYSAASFICNACGFPGTSLSYSCSPCELDLHLPCAFLPPKLIHRSHPHELTLIHSSSPRRHSTGAQGCRVCNQLMESHQWSYYCFMCDFQVHTFCGTREVRPDLYQDDTAVSTGYGLGGEKNDAMAKQEEKPRDDAEVDPSVQLYQLQLEMELAGQLAHMIASTNLSSLAP